MEDPSSSKGSEFEDVWSELHSLKKLYGFLQKSSTKSPNVDGHDSLDDKSRVLFKKLLDGATHQALQSQSKIVLHMPPESVETPLPSNENGGEDEVGKVNTTPDKLLKCHQAAVHHEVSESRTKPDQLQAAARRIREKPCSVPGKLDLSRQTSVKSTRSCKDKLPRHHHRQIDDHLSTLRRSGSKKSTTTGSTLTRKPRQSQINGGGFLAVVPVPAQKRARVEMKATGQTCISGGVDRELTHSKRSGKLGSVSRNPPSRIGSLKDRAARSQTGRIDREKHLPALDRRRESSGSRTERDKTVTQPKKKPPSKASTTSCSSTSGTQSSTRLPAGKEPRRKMPARVGPTRRQQPEAIRPHRMSSQYRRKSVGPPPPVKEGKLRRFKDKLAIIFHHHHHHHLAPPDGGHVEGLEIVPAGAHRQHRSPWEFVRGILPHRRRVGEKGKVAARGGQHGYFRALVEGLIRHIWVTRRQKNQNRIRVRKKKKLHWWQRLRRKGGVSLAANKKRTRLRLPGFIGNNKDTNMRKKMAGS